jgi:hypothetical protein
LENQPYLLDSMANYLVFCIQHIESFAYTDPFEKRNKIISVNVPSYVDAFAENLPLGSGGNMTSRQLDYKVHGSYTSQATSMFQSKPSDIGRGRPRDLKFDEKKMLSGMRDMVLPAANEEATSGVQKEPKTRGRKPKIKILEEQNALDELRKKRKRLVTVLLQEVSELELLEHLRMIILIVRNLSFVRANEHHLIKCTKLIDIVTSLMVDLLDPEITYNCLDIVTNLGKHIVISEINCGRELAETLFGLLSNAETETIVD